MNTLSSHVLDTTLGRPAVNLAIELSCPDGTLIKATTDEDGRCNTWQQYSFISGTYNLRFVTAEYLQRVHGSQFYPWVDITFMMDSASQHYHIPLLLSPYGFSSYRGS